MLERIADLRRNLGLSQRQIAEKCGVTQQFIQQIESGKKNPSVKVLTKLAEALDSSIDELFDKKAG